MQRRCLEKRSRDQNGNTSEVRGQMRPTRGIQQLAHMVNVHSINARNYHLKGHTPTTTVEAPDKLLSEHNIFWTQ
jgi:hypothetical protein